MFDVDNEWVYGKNKNWKTRFETNVTNSLPVISGITVNNGVNYYTTDIPNKTEVFKDSLTISTRGEYSGTVTYHKGEFLLANNILVMNMPELTLKQKLFIGALINSLPYGGYSGYPRKETLKDDVIKLPTKDGKIDFIFMKSLISELEEERISELSAYLKVSRLENYELSTEEKQVLQNFDKIKLKEYKIKELFEVSSSKKRFDANKVDLVEQRGFPYVVRTSKNNGVKGFIDEEEKFLNPGNTISFGQDTATMWYQEKQYFTGDKIKILRSNFKEFKKENSHFFITSMLKPFKVFSWGASSFSEEIIKEQEFLLPVNSKDEIDFEYMRIFIQAIKKLVIKDVVIYADEKIKATKKVVRKD